MCNPIENISPQFPKPSSHLVTNNTTISRCHCVIVLAKDQIVVLIFPFHSSITIIRSQQRGHSINLEKSLPTRHCIFFIILTSWSFLSIQFRVCVEQANSLSKFETKMGQNWVSSFKSLFVPGGRHPLSTQKRLVSHRLMQVQIYNTKQTKGSVQTFIAALFWFWEFLSLRLDWPLPQGILTFLPFPDTFRIQGILAFLLFLESGHLKIPLGPARPRCKTGTWPTRGAKWPFRCLDLDLLMVILQSRSQR